MLGPLVLVQWAALVALALSISHSGWLFAQSGDATRYYTTSWLLSSWWLPTTPIGYGWPFLLTPVSALAGPSLLDGLPAIVVVQTLVLLPLSTLLVYGIAARAAGRALGYAAASIWVLVPYLAIPFWDPRFDQTYTDLFLPQALGLTARAEFPSMVCLLVAAYCGFRALETDRPRLGAWAGLAAGFAVALKPSNVIFLAGPLLAFALGRRPRQLLVFALAVAPALVTLALWKHRGAGGEQAIALAAGTGAVSPPPAASILDYVDLEVDWGTIGRNLDMLREFFWSVRPLEYLPIAGAIGLARRSVPKAAFLCLWLAAFLFIKGGSPRATFEDTGFLAQLMPALPAYVLLAASIPLLVPKLGIRLASRFPASVREPPGRASLLAAVGVLVLAPLAVVLGTRAQSGPVAIVAGEEGVFVPVDSAFDLRTSGEALVWRPPGAAAAFAYRVYRAREDPASPSSGGVECVAPTIAPRADECLLRMTPIATIGTATFRDSPPPGRWVYRVGLVADVLGDRTPGLILISEPAAVSRTG